MAPSTAIGCWAPWSPPAERGSILILSPLISSLAMMVCDAGGVLKHAYFPQGSLFVAVDRSGEWRGNRDREHWARRCVRPLRRHVQPGLLQPMHRATRRPYGSVPIELLQYEFRNSEHVRDLFVSYSETLLSQVQQTVACNAMHTTEERMCRWLLMMHDRAEGEALPYTHEFLVQMLGANRKSVTLAAQSMQKAGLISYRRGTIQVLDRAGLEKASCECYAIVKERFDAFLTPPSTAFQGDNKGETKLRISVSGAVLHFEEQLETNRPIGGVCAVGRL